MVLVAEAHVIGDLLRLCRRDALPVGIGDALWLSLDDERGEQVLRGSLTYHLLTAIVFVCAFNHIAFTVKASVAIELNGVAFRHHDRR